MTTTEQSAAPSTTTADDAPEVHGGRLVAQRLKAHGVSKLFTLSGAHLFTIYDGCREEEIDLIDVRHEQTAAFAAEGWAKATREPGVCAVTAGPGVTNAMSAMAAAFENESPMVVFGGRAPAHRWGMGSLQEIDHLPIVSPLTRFARTAEATADIPGLVDEALTAALGFPGGPAFLDFPLDQVFMQAPSADTADVPARDHYAGGSASGVENAAMLLRAAKQPVIMAGTGLYWGHGEAELVKLSEDLGIPVFVNGLGRGCLPSDHANAFSRARGAGLAGADVALIIGTPIDFRLGFGQVFGDDTKLVVLGTHPARRRYPRDIAVELLGSIPATLAELRTLAADGPDRSEWIAKLRTIEDEKRAADLPQLTDDRSPLHPLRLYHELNQVLDRDAIVIGDGGDFVSYAGRTVPTYAPGRWMDPGPFGCLGAGPGYAIAAQLANPGKQVCLLLGDGAFGFAGLEFDTFVRHNLPIVAVVGNNGIWALEKHPMEMLFGYSVVADLIPGTRYDQVVEALGGHGELVKRPEDLQPALRRAFESGKPALVNVLTDPEVVYPRSTNLA